MPPQATPVKKASSTKLTYKQKLELEALPQTISDLEGKIEKIHAAMNKADFYTDKVKADRAIKDAEKFQIELDNAFVRWEELEALSEG